MNVGKIKRESTKHETNWIKEDYSKMDFNYKKTTIRQHKITFEDKYLSLTNNIEMDSHSKLKLESSKPKQEGN